MVRRDICLVIAPLEVVIANPEDLLQLATDVGSEVILRASAMTLPMSVTGVVRVVTLLVTVLRHLQQALMLNATAVEKQAIMPVIAPRRRSATIVTRLGT